MLELQRVLRDGSETLESVALRGIKVKEHPAYAGLFHFCYDQLEAKSSDPLVRESRGLILDRNHNWDAVAVPFFRFANYGESWADPIDWTTARVQEKVDGSLMIVWFYDGKWNVSTKGSPDAGGQVDVHPFTFAELFWRVWQDRKYSTAMMNVRQTYMFELFSLYNRVVCEYKEPGLVLLGSRQIEEDDHGNYQEIPVSWFSNHLLMPAPVREYPLTSIDEVIAAAGKLTPDTGEGFVVVDQDFHRVKVKSPAYLLIHHAKDGFGQRRMIDLLRTGETSEVLSYFPEYQQQYDELFQKFEQLVAELEATYAAIQHIQVQKDFAREAMKTRYAAALFQFRSGQTASIRAAVLNATNQKLEEILGLKKTGLLSKNSS